jgi:hypothetical protein
MERGGCGGRWFFRQRRLRTKPGPRSRQRPRARVTLAAGKKVNHWKIEQARGGAGDSD